MCTIIHLAPNAMVQKDHLFNIVYNNWHGYGLILRDGNNHLQVIKKFDEKGNDPEEIWDLLEKNKDIERFLHVRYSTKGSTNEDNTQPFQVYNSQKRQVWFMHNGTLNSYGTYQGKSDTVEFCEKILAPSLLRWNGENGPADYNDPEYYRLVVEQKWACASKGLFISNDLDPKRIGTGWSEYKHPDDPNNPTVWMSTQEYKERVQRGPEFNRREAERKAKEAEERKHSSVNFQNMDTNPEKSAGGGSTSTNPLKQWNGASQASKDPRIIKAISDITNNMDFDDAELVVKLTNASYDEWVEFLENEGSYMGAALIEGILKNMKKLVLENRFLMNTKARAQARLQQIALEQKNGTISKAA